jgi:MFS family permease
LVILAALGYTFDHHDKRALLPIGIGLLFTAIADRGVSLRRRIPAMAGAALAVTIGTAIGGLVSDNQVLHVVVGGVAGLACGLAGVAGVSSMTAGVLGLVVFAIFSGSPIDLLHWKTNALLMLLGASIMIASVLVEFGVRAALRRLPDTSTELHPDALWTRSKVHLHWGDPFVLHSLRLAIVMMIATMLEEVLTFPHSYWIPMTVAWISRPDRDGTVEKVTLRVAGTLLGVAIAGLLIGITPATSIESLIMIGISAYFVLAFLAPNYAVAVTGITCFVFFLFHLVGYPLDGSIISRVASTMLAAALVLTAIQIGPKQRSEASVSNS